MRKILLLILFIMAAGLLITAAWLLPGMPNLDDLPRRLLLPSIRITDRDGRLLYEALPEEGGRNQPLAVDEIPDCLAQATVATEDARFYQHPGVDWQGILRAFWINLQGGETLAGGSTITQQVARMLLLDPQERYEPTLRRKLRESLLAWQLTRRYTRPEILALYLNQSYYGSLAYGIEAAAQTYFGKPAVALDLAECSLVAGLPQSPARYSPYVDLAAAEERQAVVLGLMADHGYITEEQRQLAERERLVFSAAPYPMEAPHFSLLVLSQLGELVGAQNLSSGPLEVRTTLNLDWQHIAETAVDRQLEELRQTPNRLGHNVNSAALVALDPANGEILAMVGSPDYNDTANAGAINMALAPRQPGSALKPVLYAAAFDPSRAGLPAIRPWTAATQLLDVRTSFVTHDGHAYVPANYDQREHGPVLAREALASSLNIPAVLTMQHVGVENFLQYASRLGLDRFGDPDSYDLSLALGGGEVRLIDLTAAYGVFANNGERVEPFSVLEVRNTQTNEILYEHEVTRPQAVLDQRLAWLITDILSDNGARTLGFGPNSVLRLDRRAAVKTGTTTNFHDNWTIGYTPELVVGVWAGNPDYAPMRDVSGVSGAAPIWAEFIRSVLRGQAESWFYVPEGMVQMEVCASAGLLPGPDCPYRFSEWFIEGTQPRATETLYHRLKINLATGQLASDDAPPERVQERLVLDLPPMAQGWARLQGITLLSDLGAEAGSSGAVPQGQISGSGLSLLSPADRSIYHIDPGFPIDSQRIKVEVASTSSGAVTLWVDDQSLAVVDAPPFAAWWQLTPGEHTFWATQDGSDLRSPVVTITVTQ